MGWRLLSLVMLCFWAGLAAPAHAAATPPDKPISAKDLEFFEKNIRPLLARSCYECHSLQSAKVKGGLILDSREGLLKGGDNGPAVVPGDPVKSLLIKAVKYGDEDLQMPPKHELATSQIRLLEQWVVMGAPDPRNGIAPVTNTGPFNLQAARKFWSFQPVKDYVPPVIADAAWMSNPVDPFVRAQQENLNLIPAPLADRRTLIPPRHLRSHRPAADSRRSASLHRRSIAKRLGKSRRPPSLVARLR